MTCISVCILPIEKYVDPVKRLSDLKAVLKACSEACLEHSSVAQSVCINRKEFMSMGSEQEEEVIPTVYNEVYNK